jgi:hypothetical protein
LPILVSNERQKRKLSRVSLSSAERPPHCLARQGLKQVPLAARENAILPCVRNFP